MGQLLKSLREYADSDHLPMHMPGHKRCMGEIGNPYFIDITEIDGFDDLHHAEGILADAQKRAADLYHAEETHYLVNGSTAGVLAAVSGCTTFGGKLLMARNCHRSAYHAAFLKGLHVEYLYPQSMGSMGINGKILPKDVDNMLQSSPDTESVLLTSPTYDGIVSDIRQIADCVHGYGIPLIVDEAHGAHFHWHESFPDTALTEGADIVIESLHKTLPAFTQTGVLHARYGLVKEELLTWSLQTYQSSSPSYLLMAGAERCFSYLLGEGRKEMQRYVSDLEWFRQEMKGLKALRLFESQWKEPSKLVIATDRTPVRGRDLADRLRETYHIETEMSCGDYVIAMTSVADERKSFERLAEALQEIDGELTEKLDRQAFGNVELTAGKNSFCYDCHRPEPGVYSCEAAYLPKRRVPLAEAAGELAAEPVYPYPPGIPLLVEGERISQEMVEQLKRAVRQQISVHGVTDGFINILVL